MAKKQEKLDSAQQQTTLLPLLYQLQKFAPGIGKANVGLPRDEAKTKKTQETSTQAQIPTLDECITQTGKLILELTGGEEIFSQEQIRDWFTGEENKNPVRRAKNIQQVFEAIKAENESQSKENLSKLRIALQFLDEKGILKTAFNNPLGFKAQIINGFSSVQDTQTRNNLFQRIQPGLDDILFNQEQSKRFSEIAGWISRIKNQKVAASLADKRILEFLGDETKFAGIEKICVGLNKLEQDEALGFMRTEGIERILASKKTGEFSINPQDYLVWESPKQSPLLRIGRKEPIHLINPEKTGVIISLPNHVYGDRGQTKAGQLMNLLTASKFEDFLLMRNGEGETFKIYVANENREKLETALAKIEDKLIKEGIAIPGFGKNNGESSGIKYPGGFVGPDVFAKVIADDLVAAVDQVEKFIPSFLPKEDVWPDYFATVQVALNDEELWDKFVAGIKAKGIDVTLLGVDAFAWKFKVEEIPSKLKEMFRLDADLTGINHIKQRGFRYDDEHGIGNYLDAFSRAVQDGSLKPTSELNPLIELFRDIDIASRNGYYTIRWRGLPWMSTVGFGERQNRNHIVKGVPMHFYSLVKYNNDGYYYDSLFVLTEKGTYMIRKKQGNVYTQAAPPLLSKSADIVSVDIGNRVIDLLEGLLEWASGPAGNIDAFAKEVRDELKITLNNNNEPTVYWGVDALINSREGVAKYNDSLPVRILLDENGIVLKKAEGTWIITRIEGEKNVRVEKILDEKTSLAGLPRETAMANKILEFMPYGDDVSKFYAKSAGTSSMGSDVSWVVSQYPGYYAYMSSFILGRLQENNISFGPGFDSTVSKIILHLVKAQQSQPGGLTRVSLDESAFEETLDKNAKQEWADIRKVTSLWELYDEVIEEKSIRAERDQMLEEHMSDNPFAVIRKYYPREFAELSGWVYGSGLVSPSTFDTNLISWLIIYVSRQLERGEAITDEDFIKKFIPDQKTRDYEWGVFNDWKKAIAEGGQLTQAISKKIFNKDAALPRETPMQNKINFVSPFIPGTPEDEFLRSTSSSHQPTASWKTESDGLAASWKTRIGEDIHPYRRALMPKYEDAFRRTRYMSSDGYVSAGDYALREALGFKRVMRDSELSDFLRGVDEKTRDEIGGVLKSAWVINFKDKDDLIRFNESAFTAGLGRWAYRILSYGSDNRLDRILVLNLPSTKKAFEKLLVSEPIPEAIDKMRVEVTDLEVEKLINKLNWFLAIDGEGRKWTLRTEDQMLNLRDSNIKSLIPQKINQEVSTKSALPDGLENNNLNNPLDVIANGVRNINRFLDSALDAQEVGDAIKWANHLEKEFTQRFVDKGRYINKKDHHTVSLTKYVAAYISVKQLIAKKTDGKVVTTNEEFNAFLAWANKPEEGIITVKEMHAFNRWFIPHFNIELDLSEYNQLGIGGMAPTTSSNTDRFSQAFALENERDFAQAAGIRMQIARDQLSKGDEEDAIFSLEEAADDYMHSDLGVESNYDGFVNSSTGALWLILNRMVKEPNRPDLFDEAEWLLHTLESAADKRAMFSGQPWEIALEGLKEFGAKNALRHIEPFVPVEWKNSRPAHREALKPKFQRPESKPWQRPQAYKVVKLIDVENKAYQKNGLVLGFRIKADLEDFVNKLKVNEIKGYSIEGNSIVVSPKNAERFLAGIVDNISYFRRYLQGLREDEIKIIQKRGGVLIQDGDAVRTIPMKPQMLTLDKVRDQVTALSSEKKAKLLSDLWNQLQRLRDQHTTMLSFMAPEDDDSFPARREREELRSLEQEITEVEERIEALGGSTAGRRPRTMIQASFIPGLDLQRLLNNPIELDTLLSTLESELEDVKGQIANKKDKEVEGLLKQKIDKLEDQIKQLINLKAGTNKVIADNLVEALKRADFPVGLFNQPGIDAFIDPILVKVVNDVRSEVNINPQTDTRALVKEMLEKKAKPDMIFYRKFDDLVSAVVAVVSGGGMVSDTETASRDFIKCELSNILERGNIKLSQDAFSATVSKILEARGIIRRGDATRVTETAFFSEDNRRPDKLNEIFKNNPELCESVNALIYASPPSDGPGRRGNTHFLYTEEPGTQFAEKVKLDRAAANASRRPEGKVATTNAIYGSVTPLGRLKLVFNDEEELTVHKNFLGLTLGYHGSLEEEKIEGGWVLEVDPAEIFKLARVRDVKESRIYKDWYAPLNKDYKPLVKFIDEELFNILDLKAKVLGINLGEQKQSHKEFFDQLILAISSAKTKSENDNGLVGVRFHELNAPEALKPLLDDRDVRISVNELVADSPLSRAVKDIWGKPTRLEEIIIGRLKGFTINGANLKKPENQLFVRALSELVENADGKIGDIKDFEERIDVMRIPREISPIFRGDHRRQTINLLFDEVVKAEKLGPDKLGAEAFASDYVQITPVEQGSVEQSADLDAQPIHGISSIKNFILGHAVDPSNIWRGTAQYWSESEENIPEGDVYARIKEAVGEIKKSSILRSKDWKGFSAMQAGNGLDVLLSLARSMDSDKVETVFLLDPLKMDLQAYTKEVDMVYGSRVGDFIAEFNIDDERMQDYLLGVEIEVRVGNPHASHYDPVNNKAVIYVQRAFMSNEGIKQIIDEFGEMIGGDLVLNSDILMNWYVLEHEMRAVMHRAMANYSSGSRDVQRLTYLSDLTEGMSVYGAFNSIIKSGAFITPSDDDLLNIHKIIFLQGTVFKDLDSIDANYLEQYLKVLELVEDDGIQKLPYYASEMQKAVIDVPSNYLLPFDSLEELAAAKGGYDESSLPLALKLMVTMVTAPKGREEGEVVKESKELLIEMFNHIDKGIYHDGLIERAVRILPLVCEG